MTYNNTTSGSHLPVFDQIHASHIKFDTSPYALRLEGLSGNKIGTVTVSDSTFTHIAHQTSLVSQVQSLSYSNVTINGKPAS